MAKKSLIDYLTVGFKVSLLGLLGSLIFVFPLIILTGGSFLGQDENTFNLIWLLIIPVGWVINGYFLIKYKNWVFR